MRKADVTNGKCKAEMPYNCPTKPLRVVCELWDIPLSGEVSENPNKCRQSFSTEILI